MRAGIALAFAVGAWSLLGQFIFNRIIFFYVANSEYTAASIITLHLAGFWLGATWARKRRLDIWTLVAGSAAVTLAAEILVWRMGIVWFSLPVLIAFTAAGGIALATMSGATITRLMRSATNDHAQRVFMADTAGSVLGALVGGFWLIPHLGIAAAFHGLLLAQVLALAVMITSRRTAAAIATAGILMMAALQMSGPALAAKPQVIAVEGMPIAEKGDDISLVYSHRSPYGLISITGDPEHDLTLNIDSRPLCSARKGSILDFSAWQLGELPVKMMVPSSARTNLRVANIGLGCGITLAALLDNLSSGSRVDVIELNPMMPAAQKTFWPLLPKNPGDPRATTIIDDGFRYFATRKADAPKYDAVAIDVAWMQNMNATHLFSVEMYRNIRRNLADDGVLSVWIEEGNPFSMV
jgi:predicted membrane-bound spermidine synthase